MDFIGVEITDVSEYIPEARPSYLDLPGQRCVCDQEGPDRPCMALATGSDKLCDFCREVPHII